MLYINPIQDSGGGRNIGNKWVKKGVLETNGLKKIY